MNILVKTAGAAACLLLLLSRADAQFAYTVQDLGTLGGTSSSANSVAGQGQNAAGMVVGTSTLSDGSEHAFLYVNGQMYDLNTLCDLSLSNFKVLTSAKSISDSAHIIGEGITNNGEKHAFLLKPSPVDGGNWIYMCCKWVWQQEGGGWWWDTECRCYTWHGPPGQETPCPPQPPHCWWWPLPCPPGCYDCPPQDVPPDYCWTCIKGSVLLLPETEVGARGGVCYPSREEAFRDCGRRCWICVDGKVVQVSEEEAKALGAKCYPSEREAQRDCGKLCWICVDGN
jgi:probable HAF family extracellular repeat protein